MNWFRLKTCIKCQGDLASDEGDWICLQCGTYYYTGLYQLPSHIDKNPEAPRSSGPEQPGQKMLGAGKSPLFTALTASRAPAPHAAARQTVTGAAVDAAVASL